MHIDYSVMTGHSRPKDGVLTHACDPAIHVFLHAIPGSRGARPRMVE
jgi:hypothetical protein